MLRIFFKSAWRNFLRQRASGLINVTGLSIGMSAAILIFFWIQNEFNFDNYHENHQDIYRISNYLNTGKENPSVWETSPYLLGQKAEEELPEVLAIARIQPIQYNVPYFQIKGEFIREEHCAYVDSGWFKVFSYKFLKGSPDAFNSHPHSLLLTESKARKYFGNEDPVGRVIRIDTLNYTVRGVLKDNPTNSSFHFDALFPVASLMTHPDAKKNALSWGNYNYLTFLKLLPGANPVTVSDKLTTIIQRERSNTEFRAGLKSLAEMHFESELDNSAIVHGNYKLVKIFVVLGILLLTIACINYVNLTTARATVRVKEVSIKKIVGAERRQLFAQFVLESALVCLLALSLAWLILYLVLPAFNQFTGKSFNLNDQAGWIVRLLAVTFVSSVVLTSIYPAILLSSFRPLSVFRGASMFKVKDGLLRKALVVVQFTVSIALITGTIVIYRQMNYIQKQNSGFNREQVFTFSIPYKILRKYDSEKRVSLTQSVRQDLLNQPGIEMVTLLNQGSVINMRGWSSGNSTDWDGRDPEFQPAIAYFQTDSSFKDLLSLEIKEGRWFLTGSDADKNNSILNETAVNELGIRKPVIGQRFISQGDTGVIIGVVKDFFYKTLHEKIGPVVIRNDQTYANSFFVKTQAGMSMEARSRAELVWRKFFPGEPFNYQFTNVEFEAMYRAEKRASQLIWLFSVLAIFISCMGLYGLASFTAERRGKEIGIRKVLGASVGSIVGLLSIDFLKLIFISLLVASPLAWIAMNNWLNDFAYRVELGGWIFIAAGCLAILVAFASIGLRALKAATANPVEKLRSE